MKFDFRRRNEEKAIRQKAEDERVEIRDGREARERDCTMGNELKNLLGDASNAKTTPSGSGGENEVVSAVVKPTERARAEMERLGINLEADGLAGDFVRLIEGIEVEAVVGGALMRIRLGAGVNPARVKESLLALDPGAQVRDKFWSKNGGRPTDKATALVVTARVSDKGAFVEIIAQNGTDLQISVPRKKVDGFVADVARLGKLSEVNVEKLAKAFEMRGQAAVVLSDEERFGVLYYTLDGRHFLEGLEAEAPVEEKKEGKA